MAYLQFSWFLMVNVGNLPCIDPLGYGNAMYDWALIMSARLSTAISFSTICEWTWCNTCAHAHTHTRNINKTNKTHTHTIVTSRDPTNTSYTLQFWSSRRTLRRPHCDSSLWHRTARCFPGQVVNWWLFPTSETNQTNGCNCWTHQVHVSIKMVKLTHLS